MLFHVCSVSVLDVRVYIYVHYYVKICLGSRTKERVTDNVLNLNYDKFWKMKHTYKIIKLASNCWDSYKSINVCIQDQSLQISFITLRPVKYKKSVFTFLRASNIRDREILQK